jgi:hypothetical protein
MDDFHRKVYLVLRKISSYSVSVVNPNPDVTSSRHLMHSYHFEQAY